jgi:hypothetical protein
VGEPLEGGLLRFPVVKVVNRHPHLVHLSGRI